MKFELAFILTLENMLDPSAVTYYNRNSTTFIIAAHNGILMAEWSKWIDLNAF